MDAIQASNFVSSRIAEIQREIGARQARIAELEALLVEGLPELPEGWVVAFADGFDVPWREGERYVVAPVSWLVEEEGDYTLELFDRGRGAFVVLLPDGHPHKRRNESFCWHGVFFETPQEASKDFLVNSQDYQWCLDPWRKVKARRV